MKQAILGKDDGIARITYELFTGFGVNGNPQYKTGEITDSKVLEQVKNEIKAFQESTRLYAAVSMGRVVLNLMQGKQLEIRMVFDQRENMYSNLVRIETRQYLASPEFTALIEHYRKLDDPLNSIPKTPTPTR